MNNTFIMEHPLVKHKITLLRDANTGPKDFRTLVSEIGSLMCYEALRDLPTELVKVKSPVAESMQPMLAGKKLAVIPILRAGLGMVDGILSLCPSAKVGHIGLYRDEVTHEPHEYFSKLPDQIDRRIVIVPDPMLATGGSASDAIDMLKAKGVHNIRLMCLVGAPEGIAEVQRRHPDVDIYLAAVDDHLNEHAYIVPGLGDAGDRLFGTK